MIEAFTFQFNALHWITKVIYSKTSKYPLYLYQALLWVHKIQQWINWGKCAFIEQEDNESCVTKNKNFKEDLIYKAKCHIILHSPYVMLYIRIKNGNPALESLTLNLSNHLMHKWSKSKK